MLSQMLVISLIWVILEASEIRGNKYFVVVCSNNFTIVFSGESVAVASFQVDGGFRNDTHMQFLGDFTHELGNMTQCLRVKLAHLRSRSTVFLNYANKDGKDALNSGGYNYYIFPNNQCRCNKYPLHGSSI